MQKKRGPMEQSGQRVYYVSPDRKTVKSVADDLKQPNGIVGSPDGAIANKTLFCNVLPTASNSSTARAVM